ncbi:kinase-like domain-containing protein [Rhizophagus irregularis DAOM 181602=DAOM 197198]|uniref:Kinase-like domain-containing protein n=1 Tax=Rhizophagus irregularis (strain DAOM 181602 / DAOM 197198 / MUCL 43194) TaxID=747089 RepID=A0A2P4QVS6_RHIID|nr:kinase-like domain-containing protein [Rhizophagus irregularis DAOM 181602=DAOM 197198]POG81751.1 kinase-like domain-containing protein [Rhizophagus irregularis DAOM 181602=DAOM 197198]|eukprot:XP_025188617.1 kinase-like domain-containing protein [Rhizophagus irregularis DAOM 181602=DAOM 197198]
MHPLDGKERIRECYRCKQISDTKSKYCESCISKNNEEIYGRCMECNEIITGKNWCQTCNSKRFQQNFDKWASGNDDIDKFIQNTQLSAKNCCQILEWIPYNRFNNPVFIAEGGFGEVHKATWKDGYISHWDTGKNQWSRLNKSKLVALKSLSKSQNITMEFINEITIHLRIQRVKAPQQVIRCYGISLDPKTKNYIMVMNYAKRGNLLSYLNEKRKDMNKKYKIDKWPQVNLDLNLQMWKSKFDMLFNISSGLYKIHGKRLIHRDLHIGNIVCDSIPCITDMGLCKPANYNELESKEDKFGVISYLAPEILRGGNYTQASDIYSLGIIIYVVISESPPYKNIAHDLLFALNICDGLRPEFYIKVPQIILHLIKRCLDADPLKRPDIRELARTFHGWREEYNKYYIKNEENQEELTRTELIEQIEEAEKINKSLLNNSSMTNKKHPGAIYKSIPFNFENLSEPKNSDDYYKSYENISSKKYSEPQEQIEEAEEINNNLPTTVYTSGLLNNFPEPKNSDDYYDEQNDNIISEKFSESLQIDFSQLKISDADGTKRNFSKLAYL